MRRILILLASSMMLLTGCSKMSSYVQDVCKKHAVNQNHIGLNESDARSVFGINEIYLVYKDEAIAPEVASRADWVKADGAVWPPDPEFFGYSNESLKRWSDMGDPVAKYLLAFNLYNNNGCSSFGEIHKLLFDAFQTKVNDPELLKSHPKLKLRLPEAGASLRGVIHACPKEASAFDQKPYLDAIDMVWPIFPKEG